MRPRLIFHLTAIVMLGVTSPLSFAARTSPTHSAAEPLRANLSSRVAAPALRERGAVFGDPVMAAAIRKIEEQEQRASEARVAAADGFAAWLEWRRGAVPALDGVVLALDFDVLTSAATPNSADPKFAARSVGDAVIGQGVRGGATLLGTQHGFAVDHVPAWSSGDAFSFSLWLRVDGTQIERATIFHRPGASPQQGRGGYELAVEEGRVAFSLRGHRPESSLKVMSLDALSLETWNHVTLTYDGSSRAAGTRFYLDGRAAPIEVVQDTLVGDIIDPHVELPPLHIGCRVGESGFFGAVDELRAFTRELSPLEVAHGAGRSDYVAAWQTPAEMLTGDQRAALKWHFTQSFSPAVRTELTRLAALRRSHAWLVDSQLRRDESSGQASEP